MRTSTASASGNRQADMWGGGTNSFFRRLGRLARIPTPSARIGRCGDGARTNGSYQKLGSRGRCSGSQALSRERVAHASGRQNWTVR